jgi:hypothetical protein
MTHAARSSMTHAASNRIGLIVSALVVSAFLFVPGLAAACGGAKKGCGCHRPPTGVELPAGYPAPGCDGKGCAKAPGTKGESGCGCGGGCQAHKPKKPQKDARAGFLI